jgi:sugar/nucleoside kinase (ribokinase family)
MRLSGIGLNVVDALYMPVDFSSKVFQKYRSRQRGDGGLEPGRLVFADQFMHFAETSWQQAMHELANGQDPISRNIGGPPIVALILAAQVLKNHDIEIEYSGAVGDDETGQWMLDRVAELPLTTPEFGVMEGETQVTLVLSDPAYDAGRGERSFIINLGASAMYGPEHVPDQVFDADIALFGATALVPRLHESLDDLVVRAKQSGAITVVTTVFDFKNEKRNPEGPWPLGDTERTCRHTDLLMMDREEAIAISGKDSVREAAEYFRQAGASATVITHGANPVTFYSQGGVFAPAPLSELPVCEAVGRMIEEHPELQGDTTGCGDNFCGGVLASLTLQKERRPKESSDLTEAVAAGIVAGGAACFHVGGVLFEQKPGEKLQTVRKLYDAFRKQMLGSTDLPDTIF